MAYEARGESADDVSVIFGGITVASGIIGVVSGAMWAKMWKARGNQVWHRVGVGVGVGGVGR